MAWDLSLYVLIDPSVAQGRDLDKVTEAAIRGGATMIQLRHKGGPTRQLLAMARSVRIKCMDHGVPFIVNDSVEVAEAVEADGVHVGQDDLPAFAARRILGADRIIGVSARTVELAREAEDDGADYLGVGPVYATQTKHDAGQPIGLACLMEIAHSVSIPVVAIGGIKNHNVSDVMRYGVAGAAVISAIAGATNVEEAARDIKIRIERARTSI